MEPTSEPENIRQSRGLARFWPGHGMPAPAPRQSDEDPDATRAAAGAAAHASDQPAGAAGPTGEHPQVSDQQSQPHDDQQESDEQSPNPFAPRPHPALTSDTQMVALGSRRPADALLGGNGARWTNQGGFPPVETNGHRNGDPGPRHGGTPVVNGQAPVGSGPPPGSRSPFAPPGDLPPMPSFAPPADESPRSAFIPPADEAQRSAFIPPADETARSAFIPSGDESPRSAFIPADDAAHGGRPPFAAADGDGPTGSRSPFAPIEEDGPVVPPYAPSPFAPQAAGSAQVTGHSAGQQAGAAPTTNPAAGQQAGSGQQANSGQQTDRGQQASGGQQAGAGVAPASPAAHSPQAARPQQAARPVSASPSAAGSAQVPMPMPGRPVSAPPAGAASAPSAPTRLEPTGWATAGPRAGASGSAAVPVSPSTGGRRGRDDEASDGQLAPTSRRSEDAAEAVPGRRPARAEAAEAPLRPGDVSDVSITFWAESASEHFRADWHEVKAQFVDDPVAALTRAHDLLTEAVHELTESMLAERDELDPLRGDAKPDTESMRMAMRGYREFLDRILAL